jgi:hypothetical protein
MNIHNKIYKVKVGIQIIIHCCLALAFEDSGLDWFWIFGGTGFELTRVISKPDKV